MITTGGLLVRFPGEPHVSQVNRAFPGEIAPRGPLTGGFPLGGWATPVAIIVASGRQTPLPVRIDPMIRNHHADDK
ncbi:hypothetical protein GCM10022252_49640 [Streptosporangium oxazolinicum]|uniref:Uncharacterized protein n=1 Tax=Streptosporangium oxazolinicum TaxID=909287 RepID=A0ABP8B5M0_9ACTN